MLVAHTSVQSHQLLYLGDEKRQADDCFDVMSLGEEVEGLDGVDLVSVLEKLAEVAREGGGVAGDVGDATWTEAKDGLEGFGFGSGARGV